MKERDGARALVRDSHATPAVFAKSAEAIEKKRVSLRETASRAAVARDKKERSKSAQPIEKKLDENCTKGAKSEKERERGLVRGWNSVWRDREPAVHGSMSLYPHPPLCNNSIISKELAQVKENRVCGISFRLADE